jgi:hypothetical protein
MGVVFLVQIDYMNQRTNGMKDGIGIGEIKV